MTTESVYDRYARELQAAPCVVREGRVTRVTGQLVELEGLRAGIGNEIDVRLVNGERVRVEVVGFNGGRLVAAALGDVTGVSAGARARLCLDQGSVPAGDALLGRVIDAFGRPLDGKPTPIATARQAVRAQPPEAFRRQPIDRRFATGVRAIDALLPLGCGQRIGLFAGAGVGKSTLLSMICRNSSADVVVVGLIGERGREVGDFVRHALGPEGLERSVVVVATSDAPALVRARGAYSATAIAEHFRARGKNVLLVMDSVTRFAMAVREATLAAGEPPLTKGYTPSVFATLPALLERAGAGVAGEGTITAIYTVLVEGDDMSDPIPDTLRGILDGHIVLSRSFADRALFPAIDVLRSISRIAGDIAKPNELRAAARVRDLLAAHEESADLVRIGAYVAGSDARIDLARVLVPRIEGMIRQDATSNVPLDEATTELLAIDQAISGSSLRGAP